METQEKNTVHEMDIEPTRTHKTLENPARKPTTNQLETLKPSPERPRYQP